MIDGRMFQDASCMMSDVSSATYTIAEAWKLITLTTDKNCFVKCGLQPDHGCSNDDNALKLTGN